MIAEAAPPSLSLERVAAALRIENARLARELADAATATARLRTQLAIAQGQPVKPPTDYWPQPAPVTPSRAVVTRKAPSQGRARGYRRVRGGWLPVVLQGRDPMTAREIANLTGKTVAAVKTALKKHRQQLDSTGPMRHRVHALRAGA